MVLAGIAPRERAERVDRALHDYGLHDRAGHRPDELSGGQRQRVAIARATIMAPALILADEPTGNLDRATGDEVVRLLEALNAQGVTLVVVTHDPQIGARARRRVMMEDGAIRLDTAMGHPHPASPAAGEGRAPSPRLRERSARGASHRCASPTSSASHATPPPAARCARC